MSKIPTEFLKKSIAEMLDPKTRKERKFLETVELQIVLRDYDLEKDKKLSGSVRLPNLIYPKVKVCVLGNAIHNDEAKEAGIDYIDIDALKGFNKDRAKINKWSKQYDVLLGSDVIVKQIAKLLGNVLVKNNRFPISMNEGEKVVNKIEEVKHTLKFQLKKSICLGTAIGNVKLTPEELRHNISMAINYFTSLTKKGWQQVRSITIKTSMGKPQRIYG